MVAVMRFFFYVLMAFWHPKDNIVDKKYTNIISWERKVV